MKKILSSLMIAISNSLKRISHKKGLFIVIDGNDGSGKSTQIKMLVDRLEEEKMDVLCMKFPNESENFFGKLIYQYLRDKNSGWEKYKPRDASVFYACDRWESSEKIKKSISEGHVVIVDRYVSANQIHQGGKIKDIEERKKFILWLDELEYKIFKIPRPNVVFYLSVPLAISEKLLEERCSCGRQKDAHENDPDFLKNSKKSAEWLSGTQPNWIRIDCVVGNKMRSIEDIHDEIYEKIKSLLRGKK